MGTAEDFWSDDAAALQQREAERATGLRMPNASDTRTGVTDLRMPAASLPMDLRGSDARPSADYRSTPRRQSFTALIIVGIATLILITLPIAFLLRQSVTLGEFNSLQIGMSIRECNRTIGSPGALVMQSDVPQSVRTPGVAFLDDTKFVQWSNRNGTSAVCCFVGDKLDTKFQIGLR